jgi:hypothetical protein
LLCENNTPLFRNNCQNILIDKINTEKQKNKHIIFFESSNCFVKLKNHFDGDCFHHSKINVLKLIVAWPIGVRFSQVNWLVMQRNRCKKHRKLIGAVPPHHIVPRRKKWKWMGTKQSYRRSEEVVAILHCGSKKNYIWNQILYGLQHSHIRHIYYRWIMIVFSTVKINYY